MMPTILMLIMVLFNISVIFHGILHPTLSHLPISLATVFFMTTFDTLKMITKLLLMVMSTFNNIFYMMLLSFEYILDALVPVLMMLFYDTLSVLCDHAVYISFFYLPPFYFVTLLICTCLYIVQVTGGC